MSAGFTVVGRAHTSSIHVRTLGMRHLYYKACTVIFIQKACINCAQQKIHSHMNYIKHTHVRTRTHGHQCGHVSEVEDQLVSCMNMVRSVQLKQEVIQELCTSGAQGKAPTSSIRVMVIVLHVTVFNINVLHCDSWRVCLLGGLSCCHDCVQLGLP